MPTPARVSRRAGATANAARACAASALFPGARGSSRALLHRAVFTPCPSPAFEEQAIARLRARNHMPDSSKTPTEQPAETPEPISVPSALAPQPAKTGPARRRRRLWLWLALLLVLGLGGYILSSKIAEVG